MKGLSIRDVKAVGARRFERAWYSNVAMNVWVALALVVLLGGLVLCVFSDAQAVPKVYETVDGDSIKVYADRVVWNDMELEAEVSDHAVSAEVGLVIGIVFSGLGLVGLCAWAMAGVYKSERYQGDFAQKWVDSGEIPPPEG